MNKIYNTIISVAAVGLMLGSWRDHVALFMSGKEAPVEIYPVRVELLPEADQAQLDTGIHVDDPKELTRILEDLLS